MHCLVEFLDVLTATDKSHIDLNASRHTVDDTANGSAVTLPESGQAEKGTECIHNSIIIFPLLPAKVRISERNTKRKFVFLLLYERNFVSLRSEIFVIIPTIIYIQNQWRMQ